MKNAEIFLSEPFLSLWQGRDPFVEVESLQGEVYRELEARRTLRTEVGGRSFFVKIHRGVGWLEIFKNLFSLRLPVLGAANEWKAIKRLEALGVDTMSTVAYGRRGCNPAAQKSFIVTEDLNPTVSLEDFCATWPDRPPPPALKRALIRRVADMAGRMHRGGVNHRDFYICHFLMHMTPVPAVDTLKLSLIDLHRAQVRSSTPVRWRNKDLAALYFSSLGVGLTQRDFFRFLRAYFGCPLREVLRNESDFLGWLQGEGLRLQARFERKFSAGEPREH